MKGGTSGSAIPTQMRPQLPVVNWCLIDLLTFLYELLSVSQETSVQPHVVGLLKEIAKLAPKAGG